MLFDAGAGTVRLGKAPTTPENQAFGVLAALEAAEVPLAGIDLIVHGTTTTTNAVLERRLARTGLITTEGFRDVLELGRRTRPQAYGMTGRFTPIIPRDLRLEVPERMDARGRVLTPLDEAATGAAVAALLAAGCESLVIHFLHAYANPAHERRAAAIAAEVWPNASITLGHALLSESREYERGVTAAVNAGVRPLLERYIARLQGELRTRGFRREMLVMNGNGGMVSARNVAREAAKTVMSGPASGVMAALYTARRADIADLITYDMGGTSTDVALIRGGVAQVSNEIELEYGMPIHVPMVDVRTVGAGGGSIARVNAAGLLEVGPESAGAEPGPIAYGRGGTSFRRSRRQPHPRPARTRTASPTATPPAGPSRRASGRRSASARRRRLRRCSGSPTPGWPARSAWSRCRSAPIRATSPSSPSAGPGRCTPRRWRASSASRGSWCRPGRGSPTRWAASWPTSASISSAP